MVKELTQDIWMKTRARPVKDMMKELTQDLHKTVDKTYARQM